MNNYLDDAQNLFSYTQNLRRDFHQHPELGFHETRTSEIVARELASLDMKVMTGIGKTGIVGLLEGKSGGPVVLIRVDMDALPIQEETGAEYASKENGKMHACGHDGHVAIGLSVAKLLNNYRKNFAGTVKFVFQPAEEGLGGAEAMIVDGVLENPKPDFALSVHVWNEKPTGWIGIVPGPVMAAADTFTVKIIGSGGHGAVPNLTDDPILAASQVINLLQGIVSRNVSPLKSAVVTVGSIRGGEAFNVIPSEVIMKGTIRTFEPKIRDLVINKFHQIVQNTALAMGCKSEIEVKSITPAVYNDPFIASKVQSVAESMFKEDIIDTQSTTMGSEDMAFFLQQIPGCYIFIGSANKDKHLDAPHHSSKFDFDETILPKAVGLMAGSITELLSR